MARDRSMTRGIGRQGLARWVAAPLWGAVLVSLSASMQPTVGTSEPAVVPTEVPDHLVGDGRAPRAVQVPILLVPGWLDTARDLAALRIRLLAAGWPDDHVETITFEDPTGSNRDHAVELARAVDTLLAHAGAEEIDIVAHSMGGLATRWYLRTDSTAPVRRVVFIGSPHRGTLSAHLAWGGGREEMMPESAFLDTLNADPAPLGVEAITVRTLVDTHIVPGESATLPGVSDHLICCPTHAGLLRDEDVFRILVDFLEDSGPWGSSALPRSYGYAFGAPRPALAARVPRPGHGARKEARQTSGELPWDGSGRQDPIGGRVRTPTGRRMRSRSRSARRGRDPFP